MNKLFHTLMALKPMAFLRDAISDKGAPSFGRLGAAFTLVNSSVVMWYLTIKNHAIPDLTGLTTFTVTVAGMCFGITKAPAVVDAFKGNTNSQPAADADANKGA